MAADALVSLVSATEQQSHHDVVAQAVLQRRGEQRVADHAEVAVHVCAVGEQQPHKVVPANGNRRHTHTGERPGVQRTSQERTSPLARQPGRTAGGPSRSWRPPLAAA